MNLVRNRNRGSSKEGQLLRDKLSNEPSGEDAPPGGAACKMVLCLNILSAKQLKTVTKPAL